MPVLRLTIADLKLVYALTAFMQSRQTDPDFMVFVDSLMDELPEVPAGPGTMPMLFSMTQQAVNTVHCIAGYATYICEHEGEDEQFGLRAAELTCMLPPIRETVVVEDADRDIA